MDSNNSNTLSEGVISLLDTDLYKLTMQCAIYKFFPDVQVTYTLKNRTPHKKLSRAAFKWLHTQIMKLGNISLSNDEYRFLQSSVEILDKSYLDFLRELRLNPRDQVICSFIADDENSGDDAIGTLELSVNGLWVQTILYEIPLLALTSEAYFRFMDTDWTYDGQEQIAYAKGLKLLEAGCTFVEFGTRRRRDYHTQDLVLRELVKARNEGRKLNLRGKLIGTSNVHLAMRFGIPPVGTIAHEWFMGVAAITGEYETATYQALSYWVRCFGKSDSSNVLTDTFGTPAFLRAFRQPVPDLPETKTFAEIFSGVRQDSGDPTLFVKRMKEFYEGEGIRERKTIIFSDSLDVESCLKYKKMAEQAGFNCNFGIGTFFTNDFTHQNTGQKSTPLNIVMKLTSVAGNPAVKLSDTHGKNMGDQATVDKVKKTLGYVENDWEFGDESHRWGEEPDNALSEVNQLLLDTLRERYPNGLPVDPRDIQPNAPMITLPQSSHEIVLGVPKDQFDLAQGFDEVGTGDGSASSQSSRSLGIKDGNVLAFAFVAKGKEIEGDLFKVDYPDLDALYGENA